MDLSVIYDTEEALEADAKRLEELGRHLEETYKGKLVTPQAISDCLTEAQELYEKAGLLGSYGELAVSVDYYDVKNQERNERIGMLLSEVFSRISFIESEILMQDETVLKEAAALEEGNGSYLRELLRKKKHQLTPETERVLAALSPVFNAPYQIYDMAKLADMKFDSFEAEGEEFPLGYSLFEDSYEYEPRTEVRRDSIPGFFRENPPV